MNYLISGGGTGGHIFPAISIANALRQLQPDCRILFVGAIGRMEMERVPQAGYEIVGLPVRGFDRVHLWKNISVLWDLMKSMRMARQIIREFRPDVAIGVGGYASGAAMKVAAHHNIPVLLQEQNGFAGVTNKLLRKDASAICVAYEGMERFFPAEKIIFTGNPVRQNLEEGNRDEAIQYFGLHPAKKTLLVIGGSLGARTLNKSIIAGLEHLTHTESVQVIWQTGKAYYDQCKEALATLNLQSPLIEEDILGGVRRGNILCMPFLSRMELAYAAADLVVSRAGASSVSELCLLGKACILVPSPNVAEDHQTHNAMALVRKEAAVLVTDKEAEGHLVTEALHLLSDKESLTRLSSNILTLACRDSARRIAEEVIKLGGHTHS